MPKLLVADDSATIQKVIKLALSSEGYDILAVSDGKEALRAIQEERPDVVLIDVALPHQDACSVKNAINSNSELSNIKFILLASAFERIDESAIESSGFQGRLIKPFDPANLRKTVSELLSQVAIPSFEPAVSISAPTIDLPPVIDQIPTIEEVSTEVEPENDIKDLTESTLQWNVDDGRHMKSTSRATVDLERTQQITRPSPKSLPPTIGPHSSKMLDSGGSSFLSTIEQPVKITQKPTPPFTPATEAPTLETQPSSFSHADLEEIVRKDLAQAIEKLARDVVPQIAEKIIRQEIEKIMSEQ